MASSTCANPRPCGVALWDAATSARACRGATVGVGDMVTIVEGRLKDQVATVKHVMKAALFLHSKCGP